MGYCRSHIPTNQKQLSFIRSLKPRICAGLRHGGDGGIVACIINRYHQSFNKRKLNCIIRIERRTYMEILQLIFAGGLGAIIATVIQSFWASKTAKEQRIYQEKKDAYVGVLNAMHRSEIEKTEEASLYAGHCIAICEIVGNKEVRDYLQQFIDTNPINGNVHPDRPEVNKNLTRAMRKDLGFPLD